jgi:phage FluMu protein gp41
MKTLILSIFFVATIQNPISIKDIIFVYENDIDTVSNNLNSLGFEFEETDEKENIG